MVSISSQAARRYAEALLAACDEDEIEAVASDLAKFAEAVEQSVDLKNVLLNPTFSDEERGKAMTALMSHLELGPRAQRFVTLIVERDRQEELGSITEAFADLVSNKTNRATANVRTAAKLSQKTQTALKRALEKRTGKTLELNVTVDPSLIGGIRAEVGTLVFDGTIRAELDRLRENLRPV